MLVCKPSLVQFPQGNILAFALVAKWNEYDSGFCFQTGHMSLMFSNFRFLFSFVFCFYTGKKWIIKYPGSECAKNSVY